MKTNFNTKKSVKHEEKNQKDTETNVKNFTQNELEEFVRKSGAKGSFMIFRSKNKKDELGIDQL